MTEVSLILFDLNGVLYRYDRAARIDYLAALAQRSAKAVETAIWETGFEDSGDDGVLEADAYLAGFGACIGVALPEAEWVAALKIAVKPIPAALALVPRIKPNVTCAVLTNNNLLVRRHFQTLYPEIATHVGDRAYVSAAFRASKPDPEVYRRCLAGLHVAPEAALFIDDSGTNVAGARAAGLAAHHASSPEDLTAELLGRGLLD